MEGDTTPDGYVLESSGECEVLEETVEKQEDFFRLPKKMVLTEPVLNSLEKIKENRDFWKLKLSESKITNVAAPMVDQSELAFRMFNRQHGTQLTYTPMIHAHLFVNDSTYRRNSLALCPTDRPLIVQFCANKVDTFLSACRLVEGFCDGVDLNLGCPQMVAKRGRYGSYLQDEVDLICKMVEAVRDYCSIPVSCKIRIREDRQQTVNYARRLVEAGAAMLTVHGRTREMKGAETGLADWTRIRDVVEAVDVPVIANGNIQFPGDVERCMRATGAVAVMSAEGLLYNPLIFSSELAHRETWKVAREYLHYARKYHAGVSAMRAHVFRICHHSLLEYSDLRMRVSMEHRLEDFESVVDELEKRASEEAATEQGVERERNALKLFEDIRTGAIEMDPLEVSRAPHWISKPYFRLSEVAKETLVAEGEKTFKEQRRERLEKAAKEMGVSLKQARKRERRQLTEKKILSVKRLKFDPCARCSQPGGQGCSHFMCKKCCRYVCRHEKKNCKSHRYAFSEDDRNGLIEQLNPI
ncbi:unnamed protein product [Caenorhabditis auriculariae]|uniref:tRNA-dihydrouridine(16/17) synthase [NAD(P)(+)] n=1 Tax=Caenorhabditis auriculariae TaxID=2777116 RepID=A0A8S1H586_9PELO|nr:unnamed protein product [Caenorhabditis auriculariae]